MEPKRLCLYQPTFGKAHPKKVKKYGRNGSPFSSIPYPKMWADAAVWLPHILAQNKIAAEFIYGDDNRNPL